MEQWNQEKTLEKIKRIDESLTQAIENTKREKWVLNPSVHHNEWANFTPDEFTVLKNAFFQLLNKFKCAKCYGWLYASPPKGNVDEIRCECGDILLNLKEKKKDG